MNIFEGSSTSSEWWVSHGRVLNISQVTTNPSWQTRPSWIPPWRRSHRVLCIILSVRDLHEMSVGHYMPIIMTMRQISSLTYFAPVKSENVFPKPFTPYLSDKCSGGVYHMGCGLKPWWFIPHPKAIVDVGQSKPLSVGYHHGYVLPSFYFIFLYTKYCHSDVIPFFKL